MSKASEIQQQIAKGIVTFWQLRCMKEKLVNSLFNSNGLELYTNSTSVMLCGDTINWHKSGGSIMSSEFQTGLFLEEIQLPICCSYFHLPQSIHSPEVQQCTALEKGNGVFATHGCEVQLVNQQSDVGEIVGLGKAACACQRSKMRDRQPASFQESSLTS